MEIAATFLGAVEKFLATFNESGKCELCFIVDEQPQVMSGTFSIFKYLLQKINEE